MLSSIIKYSKIFIFTFIITFLTFISSNHIVNALTPKISKTCSPLCNKLFCQIWKEKL